MPKVTITELRERVIRCARACRDKKGWIFQTWGAGSEEERNLVNNPEAMRRLESALAALDEAEAKRK